MTDYIDVDVRPILRSGGGPFSVIMAALDQLAQGQGLRLYATFRPVPLFACAGTGLPSLLSARPIVTISS